MLSAMSSPVWLVTGAQASGKSAVADALARRFDPGVHVRGGQFARWAVRGWVPFDAPGRAADARRLLDLRYRLSALAADEYAASGFTTVVQDNIYGADVVAWLDRVAARPRHLVVLRPSVAVVAERAEERRRRTGKVAYRGDYTPERNDEHVATTPAGLGLWLDTSALSVDGTVDAILARAGEAMVEGAT